MDYLKLFAPVVFNGSRPKLRKAHCVLMVSVLLTAQPAFGYTIPSGPLRYKVGSDLQEFDSLDAAEAHMRALSGGSQGRDFLQRSRTDSKTYQNAVINTNVYTVPPQIATPVPPGTWTWHGAGSGNPSGLTAESVAGPHPPPPLCYNGAIVVPPEAVPISPGQAPVSIDLGKVPGPNSYYKAERAPWSASSWDASGHCNNDEVGNLNAWVWATRAVACPFSGTGTQVTQLYPAFPMYAEVCTASVTDEISWYEVSPPCRIKQFTEVADPCDVATGSKFETVVDYSGTGPQFVRSYRSNMPEVVSKYAGLGLGWTHNYASYIAFELNGANQEPSALVRPDGTFVPLIKKNGGASYVDTVGARITVAACCTSSQWTVYLPSGGTELYTEQNLPEFGELGVLTELHDPVGRVTKVIHSSDVKNAVDYVIGPFGHVLTVDSWEVYQTAACPESPYILQALQGNGIWLMRVQGFTDPAGNVVTFGSNPTVDPCNASTWVYNNNSVYYPENQQVDYGYGASPSQVSKLLTSVSYHVTNGTEVQHSNASYYGDGRVYTASEGAVGGPNVGAVQFAYTDNVSTPYVTVTDAATNQTKYEFTAGAVRNLYRVTNLADNAYKQFGYDLTSNWLTDVIDEQGNDTHREYNSTTGQLMVLKEGYNAGTQTAARTTSYTYLETTSDLVRTVTSPSVSGCAPPNSYKTVETVYYTNTHLVHYVIENGIDPRDCTPISRTTTYPSYNAWGQPQEIDGPRANNVDSTDRVFITYYETLPSGATCAATLTGGGGRCGQIKEIKAVVSGAAPVNLSTTFTYKPTSGLLDTVTAPDGKVSTYFFDNLGRLSSIQENDGVTPIRTTGLTYYPNNRLHLASFPNGATLTYQWTAANLLDQITDSVGNYIKFGYDSRGNRTGADFKIPGGLITRTLAQTYDARNYLMTVTQGSAAQSVIEFYPVGLLKKETTPNATSTTEYVYDALNRIYTATNNVLASNTVYQFDAADGIRSVNSHGVTTTFVQDDFGNVLKEVSPDRGTTLYGFDLAGDLTCKADANTLTGSPTKCEAVSHRTIYAYDDVRRLKTIDYLGTTSSPDVTFAYDNGPTQLGRLRTVSSTDDSGKTVTATTSFDNYGNLLTRDLAVPQENSNAPYTFGTQFSYDGNNQLKTITYADGRVVRYVRDSKGQIQQVKMTPPGGVEVTIVSYVYYYPFGPPQIIVYSNGHTQYRGLDTAYRPSAVALGAASTGGSDWKTYNLDDDGNVLHIVDQNNAADTLDFKFDDLDRLTDDSWVETSAANTYTYNENGNRLSRVGGLPRFTAQSISPVANSNRIGTYNGSSYLYDAAGNSQTDPETGRISIYNASGRLSTFLVAGSTQYNLYDGQGVLARTEVDSNCGCTCTQVFEYFTFTPDGRALSLSQRTPGGPRVDYDYIWLDDLPIAQVAESYLSNGSHLSTAITYLHPDHLGTPRLGTAATGLIVWKMQSDGFGKPHITSPLEGNNITVDVRLRLPGQIAYGVGGINYNYYRDYDPNVGRYLESDPIGLDGGLNTYGYVDQNPLTFSDADGLTKGGKKNISTEGFNRHSNPAAVERALRDAIKNRQLQRAKNLRAILKVIKKGGGPLGFIFPDFVEDLFLESCVNGDSLSCTTLCTFYPEDCTPDSC